MVVVVTTPTGQVGSRVTRLLVQAGVRPRVLVRDPERIAAGLRPLVDVRVGNLDDADAVRSVTEGADALLVVDPHDNTAPDPVGLSAARGRAVADAVRQNRVGRTVLVSSGGAERRHGVGLIDGLARIEQALDATGASVTHLRCGYFFSNLLGELEDLRAGVLRTTVAPDTPMPWVDPRDVGDVAAARLLSTDWSGRQVLGVHGPADVTYTEVTAVLEQVLRRPVRLQVVSEDTVRAGLQEAGLPPAVVEGIIGMSRSLRDGADPENARSVLSTTPSTLAGWAQTHLLPVL